MSSSQSSNRPIGTNPIDYKQQKSFPRQRRGATIGDGMVTSAKIAGATALVTVLVHSAPFLIAAFAGVLFLCRGCIWRVPTTTLSPTQFQQSSIASPAIRPAVAPAISTPKQLPNVPVAGRRDVDEQLPRQQSVRTQSPDLQEPLLDDPQQGLSMDAPVDAMDMARGFSLPTFQPPQHHGFGFGNGIGFGLPADPLRNMIEARPAPLETPNFEASPLFDLKRGRKFLGTSQMPGMPSRRISLFIGAIREGGRNIEVKLSSLDHPRVTRPYSGVIQKIPARLTLIPVRHPTNLSTFLTYEPWYSNSPTEINLSLSDDGKTLIGTSASSEEFQLLPQHELTPQSPQLSSQVAEPEQGTTSAFDPSEQGGTIWKLARRNLLSLDSQDLQQWEFAKTIEDGGSFIWRAKGREIASGTYLENASTHEIDLVITKGLEQKTYRGIYRPLGNTPGGLQVCIPKNPADARPKRVSHSLGNVYDLVPQIKGE